SPWQERRNDGSKRGTCIGIFLTGNPPHFRCYGNGGYVSLTDFHLKDSKNGRWEYPPAGKAGTFSAKPRNPGKF
ncbi:MAG: hypothetical protein PUD38_02360, partial [Firmicutes bacterium]|nr:hypothetical protein [Bacillota bacterium]